MSRSILVAGGTGRLGRLVAAGLQARNADFRVLTRDPAAAADILGPGIRLQQGDLTNAALDDVGQLFLLSPIAPDIVALQTGAIGRAKAAGVGRILKLSGSDWSMTAPGAAWSGDAHRDIEGALRATDLALRPSAWTQTSLGQMVAQLQKGDSFTSSRGPVAYIDIRDIADTAVALLLADRWPSGPLVLTGPRAIDRDGLAAIATTITGRPITGVALSLAAQAEQLRAGGASAFVQRYAGDFARLMQAGAAAAVTDTVSALLGRPARDVADYLRPALQAGGTNG